MVQLEALVRRKKGGYSIAKSGGEIPDRAIADVFKNGASFLSMSFYSGTEKPFVSVRLGLRPAKHTFAVTPMFYIFPNEASWIEPIINTIDRVKINQFLTCVKVPFLTLDDTIWHFHKTLVWGSSNAQSKV